MRTKKARIRGASINEDQSGPNCECCKREKVPGKWLFVRTRKAQECSHEWCVNVENIHKQGNDVKIACDA